jgi:hypothetical protein
VNRKINVVAVVLFLVTLAFYVAAAKAGHVGHGQPGRGFFSGG